MIQNPPSIGAYEFGSSDVQDYGGVLKMWDGNDWVAKPLSVKNGGEVTRPVWFWDGASWQLTQSF